MLRDVTLICDWPNPDKLKEQLVEEMKITLEEIPGSNYEFLQPIQLRFNELISGVPVM